VVLAPLEFEAHCRESRVLERRQDGPVLLAHAAGDGSPLLTRIWYPKGRWSSDRFWPYSDRFRNSLRMMAARGIRVPVAVCHGTVTGTGVRFVVHEQLAGVPLRALGPEHASKGMATFAAQLHANGIYCRSLNLGSVLQLADGSHALADVADSRFVDGPLSLRMRERNLGILCVHPADADWMREGRWSDLVMDYCRSANLTITQAARMRDRVRVQMERRQLRRGRGGIGAQADGLLQLLVGREP